MAAAKPTDTIEKDLTNMEHIISALDAAASAIANARGTIERQAALIAELRASPSKLHTDVTEENLDPGFVAHFRYMMEHWDFSDAVAQAVEDVLGSAKHEQAIRALVADEVERRVEDELGSQHHERTLRRMVKETTEEEVGARMEKALEDVLESSDFREQVNEAVREVDFGSAITDAFEEYAQGHLFTDLVKEAVQDIDMSSEVSGAVEDQFQSSDFDRELRNMVDTSVSEKLEEDLAVEVRSVLDEDATKMELARQIAATFMAGVTVPQEMAAARQDARLARVERDAARDRIVELERQLADLRNARQGGDYDWLDANPRNNDAS